jgi:hypothetical protein
MVPPLRSKSQSPLWTYMDAPATLVSPFTPERMLPADVSDKHFSDTAERDM